mmetsp:Transcript_14997/g.62417  ORF Transcript_14997/g.62417 Transcript_14997/m.62417 type:complete len:237 (+) Transcript_14997:1492-2202(+)
MPFTRETASSPPTSSSPRSHAPKSASTSGSRCACAAPAACMRSASSVASSTNPVRTSRWPWRAYHGASAGCARSACSTTPKSCRKAPGESRQGRRGGVLPTASPAPVAPATPPRARRRACASERGTSSCTSALQKWRRPPSPSPPSPVLPPASSFARATVPASAVGVPPPSASASARMTASCTRFERTISRPSRVKRRPPSQNGRSPALPVTASASAMRTACRARPTRRSAAPIAR